jgi:hypothetical protein
LGNHFKIQQGWAMTERETLRAIYETVRYLEKDAAEAGADTVAMYLRLAAIEADTLIRTKETPGDAKAPRKRRSAPPK